jgi:hypothetical protein
MQLLAELLDAGRLHEADIPHLGRFRDYAPATFPEVARPAFIEHLHQLGYDEQWPRTLRQSERLVTDLPAYSPTELIIGEYTRVRELSWEHKAETYQLQVTLRDDSNAPDYEFIFNVAPDCLTTEYGQLPLSGPSLLLVRTWETGRLGLKAQWLAFNPVVARYLGWQPVPDKLFAWQGQRGNSMAESVYWADGNVELPSKQQHSEAGEGWLVLASPTAWQHLHRIGQPLFLDQRLAARMS